MQSHIRSSPRSPRAPTLNTKEKLDMRVLVVEDQKSLIQLMVTMITDRWECEIFTADSLKKVYEQLFKNVNFDIAICDLNLPDAPHGEVIDILHHAGVATIALTGEFGEELRVIMRKKGVIDYIPKNTVNAYEYVVSLLGRLYRNQKIKALVVDDSVSMRVLLVHMLTMMRFNVLTACNGKEALEVLQKNTDIRLLLTDYNMPEMDGFILTNKVRKRFGKDKLAIIGISATDNSKVSAQFLKYGANDFIHKPFSYEEMLCRITQNVEMLELIESVRDAANRDYLTGMYNRRYFFHTGFEIHQEFLQQGKLLAAAMLDIDHFKHINDHYGHDCGDAALKHISSLMSNHFSAHLFARLGGEEFAILFQNLDGETVRNQLDIFRETLKQSPIIYNDTTIFFTISVGFTNFLENSLDDMLRIADNKLYFAKENGRDRVIGPLI